MKIESCFCFVGNFDDSLSLQWVVGSLIGDQKFQRTNRNFLHNCTILSWKIVTFCKHSQFKTSFEQSCYSF